MEPHPNIVHHIQLNLRFSGSPKPDKLNHRILGRFRKKTHFPAEVKNLSI